MKEFVAVKSDYFKTVYWVSFNLTCFCESNHGITLVLGYGKRIETNWNLKISFRCAVYRYDWCGPWDQSKNRVVNKRFWTDNFYYAEKFFWSTECWRHNGFYNFKCVIYLTIKKRNDRYVTFDHCRSLVNLLKLFAPFRESDFAIIVNWQTA